MPRTRRIVRDQQARLDPPTGPIRIGLDDPDERTPLFASLYAVHGLGGRHALNPERATMTSPEDGLVSFDPDDPHDPAVTALDPPFTPGRSSERDQLADPVQPDIAVCPTCGTAVSRERLR